MNDRWFWLDDSHRCLARTKTMKCPNCKIEVEQGAFRCEKCNYGIQTLPKPQETKPKFLGDTGVETRDAELARTFRCSNCRSCGGTVKRISTTGSGFSRLIDLQNNQFIVVSCAFCGVIQLYDPKVVDGASDGWPILDFLTNMG